MATKKLATKTAYERGELQVFKGRYSRWWERLLQNYKNWNMCRHKWQTTN